MFKLGARYADSSDVLALLARKKLGDDERLADAIQRDKSE